MQIHDENHQALTAAFILELSAYLLQITGDDAQLSRLRLALDHIDYLPPRETVIDAVVDGHLSHALRRATEIQPGLQSLVTAFAGLAPCLKWYKREGGDERFEQGHANAIIIGHSGVADSDGLTLGVSLMAPGVSYVIHQHPPEEIYLVLSPGQWWRAGAEWWTPGIGGHVHNPGNVQHAMRAGGEPLLALWFLFEKP